MLRPNPAQPPRPLPLPASAAPAITAGPGARAAAEPIDWCSPEDFDATGILAGIDPCESRYWWVSELHAEPGPVAAVAPLTLDPTVTMGPRGRSSLQATARRSPPTAAA